MLLLALFSRKKDEEQARGVAVGGGFGSSSQEGQRGAEIVRQVKKRP